MIADSNRDFQPIVTEVFIRGRKWIIFGVLLHNPNLLYQGNIRPNSTYYFILKILYKKELQKFANNDLSNIDFKDLINLYKNCTTMLYFFFVNDTNFGSKYPLRFRRKLL